MYGNQRWSRKKRYCCRLWLWILAPFGTLIVALLLIPVIIIALPIIVGYSVSGGLNVVRHQDYTQALIRGLALVGKSGG